MSRGITNPFTYGPLAGPIPTSDLDSSYSIVYGAMNDSSNGFVYFLSDTGTANNLIVTYPASIIPSSYSAGMALVVQPAFNNTGPTVINVNGLGNQVISTKSAATSFAGGEIQASKAIYIVYDGTRFRLMSYCCLTRVFASTTGNITLNCSGYDSVSVVISWTASVTTFLTLNNVAAGTPVNIAVINSSAFTNNFGVGVTDPAGATYTAVSFVRGQTASGTVSGGVTVSLISSIGIAAGQTLTLNGVANSSGNLYFS